jgi:predicted nucleic acid-binding Zn ribbon protein
VERIEEDVRKELARFGAPGGMPELLEEWHEVNGAAIGRYAWPARVARDGTLHVATSSSAWAFELSQLAPEILERLRGRLGDAVPKALRFAPGHLPERPGSTAEQQPVQVLSPVAEEVAEAERLAAEIGDEGLRKRVQRAAALSLARARSGRSV